MGKAQREKGARAERDIAKMFPGGRRNVQSGGSFMGGGDIFVPRDSIFSDFVYEVKSSSRFPEIVKIALTQAGFEASKSHRRPAGIIKADGRPPVVYLYLEDFITWAQALAEVGQGQKIRSMTRQARRILDDIEAAAK